MADRHNDQELVVIGEKQVKRGKVTPHNLLQPEGLNFRQKYLSPHSQDLSFSFADSSRCTLYFCLLLLHSIHSRFDRVNQNS
jgi:hypothetical protein